jgi:MinD superfamily P-loop ATPase
MSPPLIRAVKQGVVRDGINLIDCPPGTSCPVIAALRGCDYVVLVTEPTPFGLHDLTLAVETVRRLALPFGVAINRADSGDGRVKQYCMTEKIPVLLEIPEDRRIAEAYSRGTAIVDVLSEYRPSFERLWEDVCAGIRKPSTAGGLKNADV